MSFFEFISTMLFATCRGARLSLFSTGSITLLSEPILFTNIGMCTCGSSVNVSATNTLWKVSSAKNAEECWSLVYSAIIAFVVLVVGTIVLTDLECQGASLNYAGKPSWTYLSTNNVFSNKQTTRVSTAPNHTRRRKLPICRCNWITPSELILCLFALLNFRKF